MATHRQNQTKQETHESPLSCFVVMPISDVEPYSPGHFRRVYEHLIAPACQKAGFTPTLASDVKETNLIVLDILERLHSSDMVLCDLSSRNPNVLYELGFRQAFNKPVTLIKDLLTDRIFDIAGLRDIPYDHNLRIDTAQSAIDEIAARMKATYEGSKTGEGGVNSLVQLLSVDAAVTPTSQEISQDTRLILNALDNLGDRVSAIELRARGVQRLTAKSGVKETTSRTLNADIQISPPSPSKRRQLVIDMNSLFPGTNLQLRIMNVASDSETLRFLIPLPDERSEFDAKLQVAEHQFPDGIEVVRIFSDRD